MSSHPIDIHVGQRVRDRRKALKLSQEVLGNGVDLTFQQIQKYERGANRISASMLASIARILEVPVDYFFEGLPEFDIGEGCTVESRAGAFLNSREGIELASSFSKLSPAKRRLVLSTVKGLALL